MKNKARFYILLICLSFLFISCGVKKEIIWHDLRENKTKESFALFYPGSIDKKVTVQKTKNIRLMKNNNNFGYEVPIDFMIETIESDSLLEIFVYDTYLTEDISDEEIEAFYVSYFDEDNNRNVTCVSKDTSFDLTSEIFENTKRIDEILNLIESRDYQFYSFDHIDKKIDDKGYIVYSTVGNQFVWLSTIRYPK